MKRLILLFLTITCLLSCLGCSPCIVKSTPTFTNDDYTIIVEQPTSSNFDRIETEETTEQVTCQVQPENTSESESPLFESYDNSTESTESTESITSILIEEPQIPTNQTISIMYERQSSRFINYLISGFCLNNPDVIVNLVYIDSDAQTYSDTVTSSLEFGDAADVILICDSKITQNTVTLMKSGYLADINQLNEKYGYLNWSDYEESVMNAGIIDEKRCLIPIYYEIPLLIGIKEHLITANVSYGADTTFTQFVESLSSREGLVFRNPILPQQIYRDLGLDLIDKRNNRIELTKTSLHDYIEGYNTLYPDILNGNYRNYVSQITKYENTMAGDLLSDDVLFINNTSSSSITCFSHLPFFDDICENIQNSGKTPILTTLPNINGSDAVYGRLGWCLAVNKNAQCEEAILRFIKYAISFEQYYNDFDYRGIPVNKAYNDAIRSIYYGGHSQASTSTESFNIPSGTMSIDLLDSYYDLLSRVQICLNADNSQINDLCQLFTQMQKNGMTDADAIAFVSNILSPH